ncbi:DUF2235 domain-containing protein [Photobacterium sanctipauli]|uniref:DUF2235 domain-containing protein n=1 Tax=Photobacterium sanctipauli TaxID=1342794 RepID=A0A2T3NN28_9GAMM|nr:DUF2235 domain-containing protein [Photobacterium sanctipauli]PSW16926.1 DUF2235 domain-containing protein [Photobacterium sanctipauli]
MKRIIICSDGTWNRPEQYGEETYPTNVLKFARCIPPTAPDGTKQIVYYDWGIGSYHNKLFAGALGKGLDKNIMDCYRFIVHNYEPGDELYLFGFSRGAYTVRSLCGMINNCSILKSINGSMIEDAFMLYRNPENKPHSQFSIDWKDRYAIQQTTHINFIGVWDTVGAMGLPTSIFGLIEDEHLFYDDKLGSNVLKARQALALDEVRQDFTPTLWQPKEGIDIEQVWFAGVHCDVGGSYQPDADGTVLSDIPMLWLQQEAEKTGLSFDPTLRPLNLNPHATQHNEYKRKYRLLGKSVREIPRQSEIPTWVHYSVSARYETGYRSKPIEDYLTQHNQWPPIWSE